MKILVTGCAGFIGSHLTEHLLSQGHHVIGIDLLDNFYDVRIKKSNMVSFFYHPLFEFYHLNLLYLDDQLLKDVDLVIHLAARAGVRPSIENPQLYIDHNISATRSLLDAMCKQGVKKLIFASSSSVYGNIQEFPYREDMDTAVPISPYAFTKKACELMNYNYYHLHGIDVVNLRFFTVYGERQRPDLAIYKFVHQIFQQKPITIYGDGSSERDYTYVGDIIRGIRQTIDFIEQRNGVYETFNLGGSQPIPLITLVKMIYQQLGVTPNLNYLPAQPGDLPKTYADISKAQRLLGYQPQTPLEEGLSKFIKWYLNMVYEPDFNIYQHACLS